MPNSADITTPIISPSSDWEQQTWALSPLWDEANGAVAHLLNRHQEARRHLSSYGANIDALLQLINPLLDQLCRQTCTFCPAPCCISAKVWYDIKDLLFLHLSPQPRPPGQPRAHKRRVCRYLNTRGCKLPRRLRPWTCTLYLCPSQKARLRWSTPAQLAFFNAVAEQIKFYRQGLVTAFDQVQSVDRLLQV